MHWQRFWFLKLSALFAMLVLASSMARANPMLLVDMQTNEVLFARDAGLPWHPASLTKLTTALLVFRAIDAGRISLDTPVIISRRAAKMPPSRSGLPVDTALTMRDALNLLIVKSANDIAIAIAETVSGSVENFVKEMNLLAQEMDLNASYFVNPNGLNNIRQVTSARDLAIVSLAIVRHYPQYKPIFATSIVRLNGKNLRTYNELLTKFAGTTGMKTGFVCAAGMNLVATVTRNGRQLMAVILGASSERERAEMAAKMITEALAGKYRATGKQLANIENRPDLAPTNMRPLICGAKENSYLAERAAAFPFGLEGQKSFLDDNVAPLSYNASILGRFRNVPTPRPRPASAPIRQQPANIAGLIIPMPRPRPAIVEATH
ncbi:D-alanyl-D-alanine carboxypeptidase [hydrothermal vent metagenome]|uniref:D-alanyl-D-alanine carboxypeptidase n=1 Tax=hydrothermal vent metagenome TaxID=652676 RepID=A0A3B0TPQ7_9ZZZZ